MRPKNEYKMNRTIKKLHKNSVLVTKTKLKLKADKIRKNKLS